MPAIKFSERDMQQGRVITPGWYRVKINSVGEAPAKPSEKGPSTNYPVEGTILFQGDTGDGEFAGTILVWNFNSKAIGFAKGFLECFGVVPVKDKAYDLSAAQGNQIDVFVENKDYQGRTVNSVNHKYRVPKTDVQAVAKA